MNAASVSCSSAPLKNARPLLGRDELADHRVGDDQPAQPQPRRQALAGRARVDDVVGRQCLHRADRLPVEPELSVVVVLDDHAARPRGPPDERRAAARREGHAERELMGRRQHRGRRSGPGGGRGRPRRRRGAGRRRRVVDRQRHRPQALGLDDPPVQQVPVRLGGDRRVAPRSRRTWLIRARPWTNPAQMITFSRLAITPLARARYAGQRGAQLRHAARIRVAEHARRRPRSAPPGAAASHARRGNADTAGTPARRS